MQRHSYAMAAAVKTVERRKSEQGCFVRGAVGNDGVIGQKNRAIWCQPLLGCMHAHDAK